MKHLKPDALVAVMLAAGVEPTLDGWLSLNNETELHAEVLEIVPEKFRAEYEERLTLQNEYNKKFAQRVGEDDIEQDRRG